MRHRTTTVHRLGELLYLSGKAREKTENNLKDPVFVTHPWKSFKENSAKITLDDPLY
jgi:hypothetical protein